MTAGTMRVMLDRVDSGLAPVPAVSVDWVLRQYPTVADMRTDAGSNGAVAALNRLARIDDLEMTHKGAHYEPFDAQRGFVFFRDRATCIYCPHKVYPLKGMHFDHRQAWSRGGRTFVANLGLACKACNMQKDSCNEEEYRSWLEKYPRLWSQPHPPRCIPS